MPQYKYNWQEGTSDDPLWTPGERCIITDTQTGEEVRDVVSIDTEMGFAVVLAHYPDGRAVTIGDEIVTVARHGRFQIEFPDRKEIKEKPNMPTNVIIVEWYIGGRKWKREALSAIIDPWCFGGASIDCTFVDGTTGRFAGLTPWRMQDSDGRCYEVRWPPRNEMTGKPLPLLPISADERASLVAEIQKLYYGPTDPPKMMVDPNSPPVHALDNDRPLIEIVAERLANRILAEHDDECADSVRKNGRPVGVLGDVPDDPDGDAIVPEEVLAEPIDYREVFPIVPGEWAAEPPMMFDPTALAVPLEFLNAPGGENYASASVAEQGSRPSAPPPAPLATSWRDRPPLL